MNKSWKAIILPVVLAPIMSLGILGCGRGEPDIPEANDIDTAAIEKQADAERKAEAAARGVPAPDGEGTLPEDGP